MTEEEATPKLTKAEEKTNFLNELDKKLKTLEEKEANIKALVERNEELATRNLLGGKTDNGPVEQKSKEDTPKEYAQKVLRGEIQPQ